MTFSSGKAPSAAAGSASVLVPGGSPGTAEQMGVLMKSINVQLISINKKRVRAKWFFTRLTVAQLATLAATPVVLGLGNMQGFDLYTAVALILSGLSFLIGSLLASFAFRERWQSFTAVSGALQGLKTDGLVIQASGIPITAAEIEKFSDRIGFTLANGNANWQALIGAAEDQ